MNELLTITLLVWNVHGLPFPGLTGGADPIAVAEEVRQVPHDIFFGQEVWNPFMASALKKATWPTEFEHTLWRAGLFIASNVPKISYNEYAFEDTTVSKWDWIVQKGFQTFVGPHNTLFVNTHLDAGSDKASQHVRMLQAASIVKEVRGHQGPIVIAGDLNLKLVKTKREEDRIVLDWILRELDLKVAIKRKLDYVLVSRSIKVFSAATLVSDHSDHRPLLVELIIQ